MRNISQTITNFKNISLFEGLNSLRFIAAFLVLMHHCETIKSKNGLANFEWLGLFRNGGNAVTFFFVLSGFLITYLLLKESAKTGTIRIKNFYLKRILRIWPLYFLLVFIGVIALPMLFSLLNINYEMPYSFGETWYYFIFFLPGLVTFFFGHHFLEPLWSIGVEEVFYLFWAPLFKFGKNKLLIILLLIILVKILLNLVGIFFIQNELFNYIVHTFQFEAMAIGGLGAYFVYVKGSIISKLLIYKKPFQIIILLTLVTYLSFHTNIDNSVWNFFFKTPIFSSILLNLLFLYLIICISIVDNSIIKLRYKFLSFLGEISYGIYMYHMLVIFASILFLKKYLLEMNTLSSTLLFYAVITLFTIIISTLSKYLFENFFLRMKNRLED